MKEKIYKIREEAMNEISKMKSIDELEEMRIKVLGKKESLHRYLEKWGNFLKKKGRLLVK